MEEINRLNIKESLSVLEIYLENHYGYSWEFSSEICTLLESIIDYYGLEYASGIIEAAKNCKIEILPNKNDVSLFKYKEGDYVSTPIIQEGNLIDSAKKIVLPPNYNMVNQSYRGILIKQLLRLIRSSQNEFISSNGLIEQREGFKKTTFKIEDDGTLTKLRVIGNGFEEGYLDNAELEIMRTKGFDANFELSGGNDYSRLIAGYLNNVLNLKNIINLASLTGETQDLESILIEHVGMSLSEFLTKLDKLQELESKRKNSTSNEMQQMALKELEEYFKTQIAPIIGKLKENVEIGQETKLKSI